MSVVEHLEELRKRIIISMVAVIAAIIVAYIFYSSLLDFLLRPLTEAGKVGDVQILDEDGKPIVFIPGVITGFFLRLKVSAFAGIVFALPVVLFQFWRFITPGLETKEKRYSIPFVLSAMALFTLGGFIAFQVLPVGIGFLLSFIPPAEPLLHLTDYLNFVMLMVLGFGLSFEFPLVLVFLGMVGIIDSRTLRKRRRLAILMAFIIAALATPGGDPLSQTAMAIPLYLLYEVSILVIRYVLKR